MIIKPTAAEETILTHLTEESAEVIKESCKIMRFGFDSSHPSEPYITNRTRLEYEIADFYACVELMIEQGLIDRESLNVKSSIALRKKRNATQLIQKS